MLRNPYRLRNIAVFEGSLTVTSNPEVRQGETPCTPGRANWCRPTQRPTPMMDSVHCHVDNLSRKKADGGERSAVAAAAYISGSAIWNEREQKITNFGNRADVLFSEIIAPDGAPAWATDREKLWNTVEAEAKRKDARLAKTIEAALARDIPQDQWPKLLREFVAPYVAEGMVADIAIHEDGTNHNPHVHVLLTVRSLKPDGFGPKITNVDHKAFVTTARRGWETTNNKYLAAAGSGVRLDRRSHKARGLRQEPTKHRGPDRMERQLKRMRAREVRRSEAGQAREKEMGRNATREEREAYPLLTRREDWPPVSESPTRDMTHSERSELARYWNDQRHDAEQVNAQEVTDRGLGNWLDQTERAATERKIDRERHARPWYEEAVNRAWAEQMPTTDRTLAEDNHTFDEELAARRSEYEQSVWRRAINMGRSREEHELLEAARQASPELRRKIEDEVISERMRRIRARDDADRLAELERRMNPTLRERFETYVAGSRDEERDYPRPEPGPYYDPYSPAELDKARERLREDYERDEDERDR